MRELIQQVIIVLVIVLLTALDSTLYVVRMAIRAVIASVVRILSEERPAERQIILLLLLLSCVLVHLLRRLPRVDGALGPTSHVKVGVDRVEYVIQLLEIVQMRDIALCTTCFNLYWLPINVESH